MPYTQSDLDAIKAAITGGELTVRIGARMVTYRTVEELIRIKKEIEADLNASSTTRMRPRYQIGVFGDG